MLIVGENGDYSINSKSVKLKNIEANKILTNRKNRLGFVAHNTQKNCFCHRRFPNP